MTKQKNDKIARKEFLIRSILAGISILLFNILYFILYDRKGPGFKKSSDKPEKLKDYSVKPVKGKTISIIKGTGRAKSLSRAIEALGGINRFIKPGETVLIKPNVAFASPPALGATTNPELVSELVKLCFKAGAKKVMVTDNPINNPRSCFLLSGIEESAKKAGAEIIFPEESLFKNTTIKGCKLIRNWPVLYKPLLTADKVIGVSPVKSHHRSGASMSMKNWYGLLGGRRNIFHQDINTIIAELSVMIKPTLVILDGFNVMMTNGPTGGSLNDLKSMNTIIASCDQVAADSFGCSLLGIKKSELPYIAKAEAAGSGISEYKLLNPIFETIG